VFNQDRPDGAEDDDETTHLGPEPEEEDRKRETLRVRLKRGPETGGEVARRHSAGERAKGVGRRCDGIADIEDTNCRFQEPRTDATSSQPMMLALVLIRRGAPLLARVCRTSARRE
jgi:hypothetical protein